MATATVKDRRVFPSVRADRRGKMDVLILYETDTTGQYTLTLPEEDATPDGIVAAIRADADARKAALGQVIQL